MLESQYKIKKPLFEGSQISCYRTNGRGGKTLLIQAGGFEYTLNELEVLRDTGDGLSVEQINSKRQATRSDNLRWRLKNRNKGTPLPVLYENALKQELLHPFVLSGLKTLLVNALS
jgi:hypothetical protein